MTDFKAKLSISNQTFYKNEKVANNGFKTVQIKWEQMHKLTSKYHYSTMFFEDGKRAKANVIGYGNILIFDCDNDSKKGKYSYNSQELKSILNGAMYYLCTTSSHTAREHRLRLIVPLTDVIPTIFDDVKYSNLLKTAIEFLGLDLKKFDTSCFSTDRQFAPFRTGNQQYHYGVGKIINLDDLLRLSSNNEKIKTINKPLGQTTNSLCGKRTSGYYYNIRREINNNWNAQLMKCLLHEMGFVVHHDTLIFPNNKTKAVQVNKNTGWIHDFSTGKGIDAVSFLHDYCSIPLKVATKKVAEMVRINDNF